MYVVFPNIESLNAQIHGNPYSSVPSPRDNKTSKHLWVIPTVKLAYFYSQLIQY